MKSAQWLLIGIIAGCAHSSTQATANGINEALNVMTDAGDPAYSTALSVCQLRAQRIVARGGTTALQDQQDLRILRDRCDRLFAAFESLVQIQAEARRATELAASDDSTDMLNLARRLLESMTTSFRTIRTWLRLLDVGTDPRAPLTEAP